MQDAPARGRRAAAPDKDPPEDPGLASRRAALDVLRLVAGERTLDDALDEARSFAALEGPDRAFARLLATTVLRRRGAIDHVLGAYIDRPLPKRARRAMDILRAAAAQSLFLETPAHAAVSTAVALCKENRETAGYAGMANAVARRVAAAGPAAVARLPARVDAPGWLWRSWERAYGAATARAIAAAHRLEAPLDVTLKDPSETARWAEALDAAPIGVGSLRLNARRDVASAPGFGAGAWWVQDAAAAMPAAALRAAMGGDIAGKRVVDLCAAPGGKTMQLASMGADVIAVDVSGPRLKRVAENLQRVGLKATTVKADALDWSPETPADAVLLDAPCAATGTIRRHPDVAWSKTEDDVAALAKIQTRLLARAAEMTAPGGIVVYCVCSLQRDEGEARIEAALKAEARYARVPIDPATLGDFADAVTRRGDVRTTPASLASRGGCDGFYVAALRVGDVD